ncbi:hypothetical protein FACS1894122_02530 [Alphaproteobacteria bacterium]|nr:hypothetical protein FACS1894122_02530 [Alphaproteobacteria bacterium]
MRKLLMGASVIALSCQCCGIIAHSADMSVNLAKKTHVSSSAPAYNEEYLKKCLDTLTKNPLETKGELSNPEYLSGTIDCLTAIAAIRKCKKILTENGNAQYADGIDFLEKPLEPTSSIREAGAYLLFFDRAKVSKRLKDRLVLARTSAPNPLESLKMRSNILLEYIQLICAISQSEELREKTPLKANEIFLDECVLNEMKPDMKLAIRYRQKNKETFDAHMIQCGSVGASEDCVVRAVDIMVNALLYSNVTEDNSSGDYERFVRSFPTIGMKPWILDYCRGAFKIGIGTRVAVLTLPGNSNENEVQKSKDFAKLAVSTFRDKAGDRNKDKTFDPLQALRLMRHLGDNDLKKLLALTKFDGKYCDSSNYNQDFFAFAELMSIYLGDKFPAAFATLLENSYIISFDAEVAERFKTLCCHSPQLRTIMMRHLLGRMAATIKHPFLLFLANGQPKALLNIMSRADFQGADEDFLFDFLVKTCCFSMDSQLDGNELIMDVITKSTGNKFSPEFAKRLIDSDAFCALPELMGFIDGIEQDPTAIEVVTNALLNRAKKPRIGYNVMMALSNLYTSLNAQVSAEVTTRVINDLISLGDTLKYMNYMLADTLVDKGGRFTFEQMDFLIKHISDSRVGTLIQKTDFSDDSQTRIQEQLMIFNRDYLIDDGSNLLSEKRPRILLALADKQTNRKLEPKFSCKLIGTLYPEEITAARELWDLQNPDVVLACIAANDEASANATLDPHSGDAVTTVTSACDVITSTLQAHLPYIPEDEENWGSVTPEIPLMLTGFLGAKNFCDDSGDVGSVSLPDWAKGILGTLPPSSQPQSSSSSSSSSSDIGEWETSAWEYGFEEESHEEDVDPDLGRTPPPDFPAVSERFPSPPPYSGISDSPPPASPPAAYSFSSSSSSGSSASSAGFPPLYAPHSSLGGIEAGISSSSSSQSEENADSNSAEDNERWYEFCSAFQNHYISGTYFASSGERVKILARPFCVSERPFLVPTEAELALKIALASTTTGDSKAENESSVTLATVSVYQLMEQERAYWLNPLRKK